ncbi:MAG: alpha-glucosidase [Lachnospiraceae bacterium]|nr:alpha-glucosidase [Lachnospiraceae bacterium]
MITINSTINEIYNTAIGHDALDKLLLQLGVDKKFIKTIGKIKLKHLKTLTKFNLDPSFYKTLINLINIENERIDPDTGAIEPAWWKEAVIYQIYPRTFCDSNNDGIGDIPGIISKLDYLKDLGVDALWLSPIYDSPNDDNGYDIRDYYKIMEEFGTMEDFDTLLSELHNRDMKLIMDLVVNHTSDEHKWFKEALADENSPYRKYYYFRKGEDVRKYLLDRAASGEEIEYDDIMNNRIPPNNWVSFFSGSAWNYYEKEDVWALHLFSKKQMDLNWECEEMRREIYDMINFWLDKGVDGFRMDVINYISKVKGLPNGDKTIGELMGFMGVEKYYYGPRLNEFLHEIHEETFKKHNAFSVGETPGLGMEQARLLTAKEREELNMIFSFDHLETPGHTRMDIYEYNLNYFRDYMIEWINNYGSQCYMSIFYNNHDNPKMVSKVTTEEKYVEAVEKLLAVMQFTLRGTPFIYQGDEMGLTNYKFTSMLEITDVEAKNYYREHVDNGEAPNEVFGTILHGTREHGRVLLPWNKNMPSYHAKVQQEPREEITDLYKMLIELRHKHKVFAYGGFEVLDVSEDKFTYMRSLEDDVYIIDCNLGEEYKNCYDFNGDCEMIYCSAKDYRKTSNGNIYYNKLEPYEVRIMKVIH